MKKSVIKSAKTVEEAVRLALKELNTTEDKVEVNIIEQPSSGFLGIIGVKPAIIKVVEKDDNSSSFSSKTKSRLSKTKEKKKNIVKNTTNNNINKTPSSSKNNIDIVEFVQQICDKIVAGCKVVKESENDEGLSLAISGDDIGLIVGKHGETLNSIQYLAAMVYSRQQGSYKRVSIDAGGYRERREKKIIEFGTRMAQKASRTGRRISLEPMNSYERRIVHMSLQDMEGISTFSEGDEPNRRVVIAPANERSNRYSRPNKRYNNQSRDDRYKKDRPQYKDNKSSRSNNNRSNNQKTRSTQNTRTNQNQNTRPNKRKEEGNPYEHYYSKYDNRYKK